MLARLRQLRRQSLERGVLDGSAPWLAAAAVLWGAHALRLALRRETGLAWQGRIRPGEAVVVRAIPARRR